MLLISFQTFPGRGGFASDMLVFITQVSIFIYSICIALAVLQVIGVKDLSELMEKLGFKLV